MKIREISIKYGSKKKKDLKTNELLLLHQLEQLEASLHLDPDNVVLQASVKEKHVQIDEINKVEAEGAAIRCRAKYQVDGEKPTRFFATSKSLMQLRNSYRHFL